MWGRGWNALGTPQTPQSCRSDSHGLLPGLPLGGLELWKRRCRDDAALSPGNPYPSENEM